MSELVQTSRLPCLCNWLVCSCSHRGTRYCMSSQEQQLFGKAHMHLRILVGRYFLFAPNPCCTTAISCAGDGWSAPSPLPRRPRGTADNAAHRVLSSSENTGPRSSSTEAFLRNNYYYGQQLGLEESFAHRIQRELLYQTVIILCQLNLSVENRKR